MRSWNDNAAFLQQRLEILFRRLLAMEADGIIQCLAAGVSQGEPCRGQEVGLGLSHPLCR